MTGTMSIFQPDKFIRQSESGECGLACLAMIARHHGDKREFSAWRRRYPLSTRGCSLKDLVSIADHMGFHSRALKSDVGSLAQLSLPAILHWDLNHFVVLDSVKSKFQKLKFTILDPAFGPLEFDQDEFSKHFTGIALELTRSASFIPVSKRDKLHLNQLWSKIHGLKLSIIRILILSIIMQAITLVIPFYSQLAIDTALPASDLDLLNILAIGFFAILALNATTMWVRGRLVLSLTNSLGIQTAVNLFRHAIHLPISWYEKRHLGDVTSRFSSLQPITDLLTRGLVSSIVDGCLAVATLCLMIVYSPTLSTLTVGVILAYGALKALYFKSIKLANANVLTAQAIETSAFIENIRGISAIKVFCQEGSRQRLWQNKKFDVVNGSINLGKLNNSFDSINTFVVSLENLIFIYIAIRMVLVGNLTVGMVFAFQSYKQNFVGSVTRLIDQFISYRILDVHLDRISEIAFEAREIDDKSMNIPVIESIELKNISYAYGYGQPLILHGVSLTIEPNKTTVLVGLTGAGKTTLFKILCGLLQPISGQIIVNGKPIGDMGVRNYRAALGVVSQEDSLFAGSIAENIAFFDPDYDLAWIIDCCEMAAVHSDIDRMPMKYETLVGDMGSNLSGGQKQRILLARALYRNPSILMLDEGTAHLDINTERAVVQAMKALPGTRVLVAHRPDTIAMADVVFQISKGKAVKLDLRGNSEQVNRLQPSAEPAN